MSNLKQSVFCAAVIGASFFSVNAFAKPSVNEVQTCQAQLDFVDAKLVSIKKYDAADVKTVRSGLKTYNAFLQSKHINPGLLEFTGGDKAKADDFQTQIDAYKKTVVAALDKRYPQPRVFADHAVAIDGCYTKAPMDAAGTAMMTEALQTLLALAQQG